MKEGSEDNFWDKILKIALFGYYFQTSGFLREIALVNSKLVNNKKKTEFPMETKEWIVNIVNNIFNST